MKLETEYIVLGEMIRHRRELCELSQGDLAKRVGLSRVSIATIEAGKQRVLFHQAIKFCEVLMIPMRQVQAQIEEREKGERR